MSYLRKQGRTQSRDLCLLSWEILQICLFFCHIPSRVNVLADSLLRSKPLSMEGQIPAQADPRSASHFVVKPICDTSLRASSSLSFSLPDRSVKWVDALSHTWDFPGMLHTFPPTPLLSVALGRTPSSRPFLLLAPAWPRQSRNSSLMELSVAHAVRLPLDVFPLAQGNFTHRSSTLFNLHAWTLLGMGIEDRDS